MDRRRLSFGDAASVLILTAWLGLPALARAEPAANAQPAKEACTDGCHQDVANEDPKHQALKCVECHTNIPDGKADHKSAMDDMPTEVLCATAGCHGDQAKKTKAGHHKDAACETCHGEVHDSFKLLDLSACKQCHGDEVAAWKQSVHATTQKKQATCSDCHGDMHDVKKSDDPLSPMSKVLQITTCSECHDDRYVRAYRTSVHGEGVLKAGLAVAPACANCHGAHDIKLVKDKDSKVSRHNVTDTCGTCHTFIVTRWKQSKHGELWAKGDPKGPVCSSCHTGHETFDPTHFGNHLRMADKCGECHKEQSQSYRDSFHGKAARMGFEIAATCADCHTAHDMLPAKDPRSTVNAAHLQVTCQHCHPDANANFAGFMPHLEPSDPHGDSRVHLVWTFMTTLLLGVLGFFGVHTVLWLQRSIVGFRRKEFAHEADGEVWIRRFRPVHIWIHITIVLTFLLLAATGLPLKFSNLSWAPAVATLFGGLGGSRWLHRIAGVLTFAYSFTFLAYLVREAGFKHRKGLFWGWQSMVPSGKDLRDLWANLRWFLYLGPRPKLDRWSYWEKFDFFAVFWGVPIIGLSGLMLWVPGFVTRFLPGWVLNVAYLIHSDEALLATGFIFFFHFFHTHLRPEAFPMDPVIFTGSMSLERFKHDRPLEYERLAQSGELEKLKVTRPSERTMRRVYRFGAVTLGLGVLLGLFLFIAAFKGLFG